MSKVDAKPGRSSGIQVIARAAAILRILRDSESGLSLGQIARQVGLPRSTVQRIVGALQGERLVIASSAEGGLRLGPEFHSMADHARYDIVESCRLMLSELAQATGETVDLAVQRGAGMIFLDQVPGLHRLRTVSSVGEAFPLTTTANGRAALAQMDDTSLLKLAEAEWLRTGQQANRQEFVDLINRIRDEGLAYDLDEHTQGISAIGFAFRDWSGEIHSISVPIPSSRYSASCETVKAALNEARKQAAAFSRP
ncbi:MAG: helix-turn-helix domain-containing protein [Rhizobiaceae bacterium]|nr:helix-turn-helix domain-containing protein [Rhizobiaceae bacterium]